MSALRVLQPGAQTTVQDLGRPGYAAIAIAESGAADTLSLRVGNRLVGNADGAPALEMALLGGEFHFDSDALIALAGADGDASLNNPGASPRPVPLWTPVRVRAGDTLRIGTFRRRARAYLCIAGGLRVPLTLGSASTHLGARFGGHEGRALRTGDVLSFGPAPKGAQADEPPLPALSPVARALIDAALDRPALRATPGAHEGDLDAALRQWFWSAAFVASSESNRVGVRLRSPSPPPPTLNAGAGPSRLLDSEGMAPGAVQLPDPAEPIILLAERPTTGGYPVIACVATIDVPAATQVRPGAPVRFERVSLDSARAAHAEFERRLREEIPPHG